MCTFKLVLISVQILAAGIPTAESLKIISQADSAASQSISTTTGTMLKRDDWMLFPETGTLKSKPLDVTEGYDEPSSSHRMEGGTDFFSSLGTEKKKPPRPERPDPDKVIYDSIDIFLEQLHLILAQN